MLRSVTRILVFVLCQVLLLRILSLSFPAPGLIFLTFCQTTDRWGWNMHTQKEFDRSHSTQRRNTNRRPPPFFSAAGCSASVRFDCTAATHFRFHCCERIFPTYAIGTRFTWFSLATIIQMLEGRSSPSTDCSTPLPPILWWHRVTPTHEKHTDRRQWPTNFQENYPRIVFDVWFTPASPYFNIRKGRKSLQNWTTLWSLPELERPKRKFLTMSATESENPFHPSKVVSSYVTRTTSEGMFTTRSLPYAKRKTRTIFRKIGRNRKENKPTGSRTWVEREWESDCQICGDEMGEFDAGENKVESSTGKS